MVVRIQKRAYSFFRSYTEPWRVLYNGILSYDMQTTVMIFRFNVVDNCFIVNSWPIAFNYSSTCNHLTNNNQPITLNDPWTCGCSRAQSGNISTIKHRTNSESLLQVPAQGWVSNEKINFPEESGVTKKSFPKEPKRGFHAERTCAGLGATPRVRDL